MDVRGVTEQEASLTPELRGLAASRSLLRRSIHPTPTLTLPRRRGREWEGALSCIPGERAERQRGG
jgi:hypothetical protein